MPYRAGRAVQWQAYSDSVEARRLDREARRLVLRAGSDYMFAYADLCSRWMEREYTLERDRWLRSEEQKRIQVVRDLLEARRRKVDHLDTAWTDGTSRLSRRDARQRLPCGR